MYKMLGDCVCREFITTNQLVAVWLLIEQFIVDRYKTRQCDLHDMESRNLR